jgi:TRAP transporter TAXI family solute receptor
VDIDRTLSRRQRLLICIVVFSLATVAFPGASLCDGLFASVGSGASSGVYYKVAKALCALVNRDPPAIGIWCSPEATPRSVYNLQRLKSRGLDFAIVESDVQFDAFTGNDAWTGNAFKKLRSVLSLHPELMTIIARSGAGIADLNGLRRRRLNIGSFGSGTRATWDALENSLGWEPDAGVRKSALKPDATTNLLCSGDLDASLLLVEHPSAFVQRQISTCRTTLWRWTGHRSIALCRSTPITSAG